MKRLQTHIDRTLNKHEVLGVFGLILFTDEHPHVVKILTGSNLMLSPGITLQFFQLNHFPDHISFQASLLERWG